MITSAFIISRLLAGRRIAQIADVATTMANANGAARIIKAAGARSVTEICFARAIGAGQTMSECDTRPPRSTLQV